MLLRLGIGHYASSFPCNVEWSAIQSFAESQGLYGIVLDGIEKLPQSSKPNQEFLLEWIGEVLQGYEYRYEQYCKTIAELAGFYNLHGYKMMVLKGYACSLNWPKPEHRPCGDIDIWLFGKQKEADKALLKANTNSANKTNHFAIDTSHHHHTVFNWGDFMVENHYDFINVHHLKGNVELEKLFKNLGDISHTEDSTESAGTRIPAVEVQGEHVYLPSPNLHALFLLKHLIAHFVGERITLRQLLDWAFHVKKYHDEIDWKWLDGVMEQHHMKEFFNCINAICVEDLGFDACIFNGVQFYPALKDKVLADILNPKFPREEPQNLVKRLVFKCRRWKGNAWKRELCYKESTMSAFWSGVWSHLLKPASI